MEDKHLHKGRPPVFFQRLLRWFCSPDLLEELEGDLEETFEYNLELGLAYARRKYIWEVLHLLRPSVIRKLKYNNKNSNVMMTNYGKVAFRHFVKNRTYVLINILCIGVGLACCIVSYLNFHHNNSFDEQHANIDQIYRINYQEQDGDRLRNYGTAPWPLSVQASELVDVEQVVRYNEWHGNIKHNEEYFDINVGYVSANFLDVFNFPLQRGSKISFDRPGNILISEAIALKIYGSVDVVGQTINHIFRGQESSYVIGGVLEPIQSNSSFNFEAIVPINNLKVLDHFESWQDFSTTFLLINQSGKRASLEEQINAYATEYTPGQLDNNPRTYYLDPLHGMASRSEAANVIGPLEVAWPVEAELVPAIISALVLIIAIFTFMNTAIASASSRLKEIGVRKVMGGRNNQIVHQFLIESLIVCFISLLLALPLSRLLVDQFNQLIPFMNLQLNVYDHVGFFVFIAALVFITGIVAGGYPAFYLSKFQPSKILKGQLKYKSVGRLSKVALTTQFAFSMLTITASILFVRNAEFQEGVDLGFDTDQNIVIRFGDKKEVYRPLRNALQSKSSIIQVTASTDHVGRRFHTAEVTHEDEQIQIAGLDVGPNYIETVELNLTRGRDFDQSRSTDYLESIIINERFAKVLGWADPIGKKVTYQDSIDYYVIGVVEDFYFDAFNNPIVPLWLRLKKQDDYNYLIAKSSPDNVTSTMEEIKMTYRELFNEEPKDIKAPDHVMYESRFTNSFMLSIFIFMGTVALVMSMVGFYALVSLNLFGKMKEIGVRKVLGSSIFSIVKVINKDYAIIVSVGVILGSLASYLLIPFLMDSIWTTHAGGSALVSFISISAMIITCMATVGIRVMRAAKVNPVKLLRDE